MRIAILGLHHDSNMGDPLICQTVEKLYEREVGEDIIWDELELKHDRYFKGLPETIVTKIGHKLFNLSEKLYKKTRFQCFKWLDVLFLSWAFAVKIKYSQAGIIAGGGIIHYKFHDYAIGIAAFIRACSIKNIPVVINCVGVEGHDSDNIRCKILKKYLSNNIVKILSSRDDIALIKECYVTESRQTDKAFYKIPDPAIFCSEIFNIEQKQNSDVIGIGLIRGTIFKDYRVAYSATQLVDYYCKIVEKCKTGG